MGSELLMGPPPGPPAMSVGGSGAGPVLSSLLTVLTTMMKS